MNKQNFLNNLFSSSLISVLAAFISSRLLCSYLVYQGHSQSPYLEPIPGGWEGVANWWLNPWTTYDSVWYLQIAAEGYQEHTTAFFPLYPWLLGLAGNDPINMAAMGVVISHVALLIALLLVYKLTTLEMGEKHARATVWLLAFTPAAPFFGAVYTESLFLALLAGTFLAARQQRWWLAGLLGMLVALLRNPGLLVAGALILEAWDNRKNNRSGQWFSWVLPVSAFILVQAWFSLNFSSAFSGIDSQSFYHRQFAWPWLALTGDIKALFIVEGYGLPFFLVTIASLIASAGAIYLTLTGWRKFKLSYLLLIGGITLMNLCMMRQLLPHTVAAVRYMGGLFPVAQICAWYFIERLETWPKLRLLLIGVQMVLFVSYSYMFGQKSFLG